MKKASILALSLGLLLALGVAGTALAAETSVTGHLRGGYCFVTMGAHGPSHEACAVACAKKGIPVLLVQNKTNKYFVLLPPKRDESIPSSVISKMETEVTVTGTEYTKGGITFLTVNSIK